VTYVGVEKSTSSAIPAARISIPLTVGRRRAVHERGMYSRRRASAVPAQRVGVGARRLDAAALLENA
jgi:hypothetical protein